MPVSKNILYSVKFVLLLFVLQFSIASCEKEYSVEGGNTSPVFIVIPIDSSTNGDTVAIDPGALPGCPSCVGVTDIPFSYWSFNTGSSLLCGKVDTAFVLNLERSTFTFFGPSYCGADTGLVFTVSLGNVGLTQDVQNLVALNATFYYYHTNQPYVLLSRADQPFYFTITQYSHATKIATGTFNGAGFRIDGRAVNITNGKFKFKIV